MKQLLSAVILSAFTWVAHAKEQVTLVYSWGFGDSFATINRAMVKEANASQGKYQFLFDARPGGGGSIAANHVARTPNTILISSSAFYIRPVVYPDESYDLSRYKVLLTQFDCPMAITARKYSSWNQVPQDQRLTIGTSGLGVTTHLAASQIITRYPNLEVVPFKATSESLLSVVSGQTDLHVAFLSEIESWAKNNSRNLHVLGITGRASVKQHKPLINQGFPGILADMNVPFQLIVPVEFPDTKYLEIREILQRAMKSKSVKDLYAIDHCIGTEDRGNLNDFYRTQQQMWRNLASGMRVN